MSKLSYAAARRVLDGAVRKAKEIEQPMVIAIVDEGANLVAFGRMDGALLVSVDVAQKKAVTAVGLQMNTADLAPLVQPGQPLYGIEVAMGGLMPFGGGVVLKNSRGEMVGAIGVSAGSVEQDTEVAEAGAAALTRS